MRAVRRWILPLAVVLLAAACSGDEGTATPPPASATQPAAATPSRTETIMPPVRTPTPTSSPFLSPTATGPPPTSSPSPTPTATEPSVSVTPPPGKLDMKVLNYSTPVKPGEVAFIALIAKLGSTCTVKLDYSVEKDSQPNRLKPKPVDSAGLVDWTWKVQQTQPQTITATASCSDQNERGTRQFTIEVVTG